MVKFDSELDSVLNTWQYRVENQEVQVFEGTEEELKLHLRSL